MKRIMLFLFISLISSAVFAQTERLSEEEYNAVLLTALEKASSRDRRVVTKEVYFTGEQVTGKRSIITDFAGPDAKKIEVEEDLNGKKTKSDSITLNGQFYCREGEKDWKRADKECAKAGKMVAIPDAEYEYFVEPHPKDAGRKVYVRRAKFDDTGNEKRDSVVLKFIEIRFTKDDSGAIVEYSESRRGGMKTNGWSSTQETRYEYVTAEIKAPIQ